MAGPQKGKVVELPVCQMVGSLLPMVRVDSYEEADAGFKRRNGVGLKGRAENDSWCQFFDTAVRRRIAAVPAIFGIG